MSYKFNPCTTCPCETTCPSFCAYAAWHKNVSPTMQALTLKSASVTIGAGVTDEWKDFTKTLGAVAIPTKDTNGVILFSTDGLLYTRPLRPDGFNVLIELYDDPIFTPIPLTPHFQWKRIKTLTITKGADSLAYKYDATSDRIVRDDALTTIDMCLSPTITTILVPRLFTEAQLFSTWNVRFNGTFAGFGPGGDCTVMNGAKTLNTASPLHLARPIAEYIDGYIANFGDLALTVFTNPGGFLSTSARIRISAIRGNGTCDRTATTTFMAASDALGTAKPSLFSISLRAFFPGIGFRPTDKQAFFSIDPTKTRLATVPFVPDDFEYDPVRGISNPCVNQGSVTAFSETIL